MARRTRISIGGSSIPSAGTTIIRGDAFKQSRDVFTFSSEKGNLTAGQTVFVIPGGYAGTKPMVYRNGLSLITGQIDTSSGTAVVLATPVDGDEVVVVERIRSFDGLPSFVSPEDADGRDATLRGYAYEQAEAARSAAVADVIALLASDPSIFLSALSAVRGSLPTLPEDDADIPVEGGWFWNGTHFVYIEPQS